MTAAIPFSYEGQTLRSFLREGESWFLGGDACSLLELDNVGKALASLDDDERSSITISDGTPGNPTRSIISESGLYSLILRSRKPEAKAIKRWVTHEVLPAIRKTGSYGVTAVETLTPLQYALRLVEAEQRAEVGQQFRRAIEGGDGLTIRLFHKKYFSTTTERTFFEHLYAKDYLIDQRGKGTLRESGSKKGTRRDGSQHRQPTAKGKPWFYSHGTVDGSEMRRENTRVRPGAPELELRDRLAKEGLTANENSSGLFGITGGADPKAIGA